MLQWHLSPLGSYISTNKRFFNVRAPGGVWGVLGTVVAGICQSPVQAVEACCSGGSAPGPASAVGKGMWCPTRRAEQGWAARKELFQATSLPLGVCSAVLEVPGSRLVSDCAYTIASGWVLSTLRLRPLCYPPHLHAGFGFAAGLQRTRRRSGQGLAQTRLWLSCSDASWPIPAFPWAQMSEGQETKLNSIWNGKNRTGQTRKGIKKDKGLLHYSYSNAGLLRDYWEWAALSAGVGSCISKVHPGSIWGLRKRWGCRTTHYSFHHQKEPCAAVWRERTEAPKAAPLLWSWHCWPGKCLPVTLTV